MKKWVYERKRNKNIPRQNVKRKKKQVLLINEYKRGKCIGQRRWHKDDGTVKCLLKIQ